MTYGIVILSIIVFVLLILLRSLARDYFVNLEVLSQVKHDCIYAETKCRQLEEDLKCAKSDLKVYRNNYFSADCYGEKHESHSSEKLKNLVSLAVKNDNSNEARNAAIKACQLMAKDMGLK